MISLLLIITGHLAYGITNVLWKNPQEKLGTLPLILFRSFCCFVVFLSLHILSIRFGIFAPKSFTTIDLLGTIGICAVNYFGLFFYLKSLKYSSVSNTIGFGKINLIIGIIIGIFYYNEKISIEKAILGVVIVIAVTFIEKSVKTEKQKISKGLIYTFLSRLFWATWMFFPIFIAKVGFLLFCTILEATVFFMSLFLFLIQKNKKFVLPKLDSKTKYELLTLVILGIIGTFCFNYALAITDIITIAFLGLIEPIIGLILAMLYHKEKLNKLQIIGISLGLFSSFIFTFFK